MTQTILVIIYILTFFSVFFAVRATVATNSRLVGIDAVHMFQQDNIRNGYYTNSHINYYRIMLYSTEEIIFLKPFSFGKYSAIKPEYFELLKSYADIVSNKKESN